VTVVLNLAIGVLSAVIAVMLMQAWPPRYRWSTAISWTTGEESGLAIHRVKLGRSRRRLWKYRGSPMDVTFRARVAVDGIGAKGSAEKVVAIPVDKEWRPVIASAVLVNLRPELCDERDLRYFPTDVRAKRANGTCELTTCCGLVNPPRAVSAFGWAPAVVVADSRISGRSAGRTARVLAGCWRRWWAGAGFMAAVVVAGLAGTAAGCVRSRLAGG
jgi:hypothetical protein